MPGFVLDASEFWPAHPGRPRIRRRRDRHPHPRQALPRRPGPRYQYTHL